MALYHIVCVLGVNSHLSWFNVKRTARRIAYQHGTTLQRHWNKKRSYTMLLSSSLIVLRNQDDPNTNRRFLVAVQCNYAELSPKDSDDDNFLSTLCPSAIKPAMKFLDDLKESLPSSSDFEQVKQKLSNHLSELSQRISESVTTDIISNQATHHTELLAETLSETISETKEAFSNITNRFVKDPTASITSHTFPNDKEVTLQHDLDLPQEIIDKNKLVDQDDTELLPRFKSAVRQFKAEIEADQSGDPPISLVSRKAKERIENFIKSKKKQFHDKIRRSECDQYIELDAVMRPQSTVSEITEPLDKEESIMEYIISKVPGVRTETVPDPELVDIMSMQKGTYYNDAFLIDSVDVEDEVLLTSQGWMKEIAKPNLNIWKKHSEDDLTLYKIFGSFDDISAIEFYNAQVNDEYRMVWDKSVNSLHTLDVIDSNTEIMYWAVKFPFPLKDRDYVFERSHLFDEERCRLEVSSRSVTHRSKPEILKYARVLRYGSRMVITGNDKLNKKGMKYVLTYYDDFRAPIPTVWMDHFANDKIPEFLDKVHDAAEYLGHHGTLYLPYSKKKRK